MPQTLRLKLKKNQQRGGAKASVKTTAGIFVPTDNSDLILSGLFKNCVEFKPISTSSSTGFVFDMHLPPGSTIQLRSQTLGEHGNPLTQKESKERVRFVNTGLLLSNCCIKLSLVDTKRTYHSHKLDYDKRKKLSVTSAEASVEVVNQKDMYEASICGAGVHGVFMPDAITHEIMKPDKFENLVKSMKDRAAGIVTADSQKALDWIIQTANTANYDIQVFCMELIGSTGVGGGGGGFTTFKEFYDRTMAAAPQPPSSFQPDAVAVACKVAAAVLSTFTKSSFWSYDTHGKNIMTNGFFLYLLDFGRVYHILKNRGEIKRLFTKLIAISGLIPFLAKFFGVAATTAAIQANFDAIYDRYSVPDRAIVAGFFTIDPAAVPGDIARVRSNIFEILALLTLIDGMTNHFKFAEDGFQCYNYMHLVFHTQSTFDSLERFLDRCASTLAGFDAVCTARAVTVPAAGFIIGSVSSNLDVIARLLQDALVPCVAMGSPLARGTFRLPPPGTPLSPDELEHQAARDALMEQEEMDRRAAAGTTVAGTTVAPTSFEDNLMNFDTVAPTLAVPSPFLQASPASTSPFLPASPFSLSPFPPPTQNQLRAAVRNQFPHKGVSRQLVNSKTAAAAAATVVAAAAIKDLQKGHINPLPGGQKTKINAKLRVRRRYAQNRQRTRRRGYRASRTSRTGRTSRRLRWS